MIAACDLATLSGGGPYSGIGGGWGLGSGRLEH